MSDSTPGTAMRRLLLDVTSSTSTEWNTGVQRVARSLACACLEAAPTLGVRCRTVHAVTRRNQFAPLRRRHDWRSNERGADH